MGTGSTWALTPPRYWYRGRPSASAAALATASEVPRMALAPKRPLLGVPSASIISRSTSRWSSGVDPHQRVADGLVDVLDGVEDALAPVGLAAVAQFDGLEGARGRARRYRGPAPSSARQLDIDLDGGIAPRIEYLPSPDAHNGGHRSQTPSSLVGSTTLARPVPDPRTPGRRAPAMRAASSTRSRKRRAEPRRASSGSTFSLRARFTTANSRSPTSAATPASSPVRSSCSISSVSSLSLASTSTARSQSKPTAAARCCSFWASRSGRERPRECRGRCPLSPRTPS